MGGGVKYLVCPDAKVKKAKEQIDSEWQPDNANNAVNVWRGQGWIVVSSAFLNSANGGSNTAWWVIDANYSPLVDVTFRPMTNNTWFDNNTYVFNHDISFEHKVGAEEYRGLVGNKGL